MVSASICSVRCGLAATWESRRAVVAVLAEEPGRVVPRQELFSRVWDPVWIGTGKTLDVHVASLRKKLGDGVIATVHGFGYRLGDGE